MTTLTAVRRLFLSVLVAGAGMVSADRAQAAVHLWEISEIYSNADGSVQYIELFTNSNFENITNGREVRAFRDGTRVNTFVFDRNLSGSTSGHLLLATGPIEGVEPDFIIPENFIPIDFETNASIDISEFSTTTPRVVTYSSIPTDGFRSLDGQGNVREPATATNQNGDTAELSPPEAPAAPEIFGMAFRDNAFEMSFTTESGRTYTVEFTDSLTEENWQTLETVAGDGEPAEIIDEETGSPSRFYRVLVE